LLFPVVCFSQQFSTLQKERYNGVLAYNKEGVKKEIKEDRRR